MRTARRPREVYRVYPEDALEDDVLADELAGVEDDASEPASEDAPRKPLSAGRATVSEETARHRTAGGSHAAQGRRRSLRTALACICGICLALFAIEVARDLRSRGQRSNAPAFRAAEGGTRPSGRQTAHAEGAARGPRGRRASVSLAPAPRRPTPLAARPSERGVLQTSAAGTHGESVVQPVQADTTGTPPPAPGTAAAGAGGGVPVEFGFER